MNLIREVGTLTLTKAQLLARFVLVNDVSNVRSLWSTDVMNSSITLRCEFCSKPFYKTTLMFTALLIWIHKQGAWSVAYINLIWKHPIHSVNIYLTITLKLELKNGNSRLSQSFMNGKTQCKSEIVFHLLKLQGIITRLFTKNKLFYPVYNLINWAQLFKKNKKTIFHLIVWKL